MKRTICGVLVAAMLSSCAYTPGRYDIYKRGKLVEIHERIGEAIEPNEREQYDLFKGVEGFKSAVFYSILEGGFEVVIETENGVLRAVNRDPKALEILYDWIDGYYAYQDEAIAEQHFFNKWGVVDEDTLGFFITKAEISEGKFRSACVGGCGCCLLGLIPALAGAMSQISIWIDPFSGEAGTTGEEEANRTFAAVMIGSFIVGTFIGYVSGGGTIKAGIKKARKLKEAKLSAAAPVIKPGMPIVISEKVGEVIDFKEREALGIFRDTEGFKQAIFLQFRDGSYAAEIIYEEDGADKKKRLPQSQESIEYIRKYINACEALPCAE
jgi:hypothetical protein